MSEDSYCTKKTKKTVIMEEEIVLTIPGTGGRSKSLAPRSRSVFRRSPKQTTKASPAPKARGTARSVNSRGRGKTTVKTQRGGRKPTACCGYSSSDSSSSVTCVACVYSSSDSSDSSEYSSSSSSSDERNCVVGSSKCSTRGRGAKRGTAQKRGAISKQMSFPDLSKMGLATKEKKKNTGKVAKKEAKVKTMLALPPCGSDPGPASRKKSSKTEKNALALVPVQKKNAGKDSCCLLEKQCFKLQNENALPVKKKSPAVKKGDCNSLVPLFGTSTAPRGGGRKSIAASRPCLDVTQILSGKSTSPVLGGRRGRGRQAIRAKARRSLASGPSNMELVQSIEYFELEEL